MENDLIKIKSIQLIRAEGLIAESGMTKTVDGWSAANAVLWLWSGSAPKSGATHKVDFIITFEDGETYTGIYPLQHWTVAPPSLDNHVIEFIGYYMGTLKPEGMPDDMWDKVNKQWEGSGIRTKLTEFIQKYDLRYLSA